MEEPAIEVGPQTPVSTVQVAAYCAHCNYNLYSQRVLRDDRLGVLVCRCPECGRFTAAGAMSTANQKLMQRLAAGGIIAYISVLLGALAVFCTILGAIQAGILQTRIMVDFPPPANPNLNYVDFDYSMRSALIGSVFTGTLLGVFLSMFCWHWRRGWRWLAAVVPFLLALIVWSTWDVPYTGGQPMPKASFIRWGITWLGVGGAIQAISIIAGELTGRPIGRLALRILVPSSLLQYLAFLWFCDGKTPPSARSKP